MATTAFFSGVESGQHWMQCVSVKVQNVLMSYWQFKDSNPGIIAQRKKAHPGVNFMVDSGAHTFITDYFKFQTWKQTDFEAYVKRYTDWLRANRSSLQCAVELDIDYCLNMVLAGNKQSTIGSSIVEGWQKTYFKPLENLGLPIIYVWHEERGLDGWEDMCRKHAYVGLPGAMSAEKDFNKYMTVARRYCTKVHGFAATKQLDFRDVSWFSVDSITWKTGEMYGTLIDWDVRAQRLTIIDDKSKRYVLRAKLDSLGFDSDAIIADKNYKEVTRYSLYSMRMMEAFYVAKYAHRTFYYDLRLPPVSVIRRTGFPVLKTWWEKFRPAELFKQHQNARPPEVVEILCTISAVQTADSAYLNGSQPSLDFLKAYFPKLADPLIQDLSVFQKELAAYISPSNPPAIARTEKEQYLPENNPPKLREVIKFSMEDLAYDPLDYPLLCELE